MTIICIGPLKTVPTHKSYARAAEHRRNRTRSYTRDLLQTPMTVPIEISGRELGPATHLFHDAGFPLGERRVPAQLVLDVLHFDFHPALGLLAVGRRHVLDGRRREAVVHQPVMVGRFVAHVVAGAHHPLDASLVHGTAAAGGTASHHGRCARSGRTLLLSAATAVVVHVRRIQQRHVRRVSHAETVVAAAAARRAVHLCPPHALDRLRPVIRALDTTRRAAHGHARTFCVVGFGTIAAARCVNRAHTPRQTDANSRKINGKNGEKKTDVVTDNSGRGADKARETPALTAR